MVPEIPFLAADTVGQVRELGGEELLRRLGELLFGLTPRRLSALAEALRRDDLAAARLAAHALGSTAGTVGAGGLLAAAQGVEAASSAPEARTAAAVLEGEWHRLRQPLGQWLGASGEEA